MLPSRLIEIASDSLKLVLTGEWATKPAYATLSHCWGNKDFFQLQPTNLQSLLEEVPVDELPKTFRDAADITRRLCIRYLWIDSLCIIQGDSQDWKREAALMSSVYGSSSLNIAASSAEDASQGCFLKPENFCGGFMAELLINGTKKVYKFVSPESYRKAVSESHLATRAWTLQEKLLAPRTLHVGDRGLFWECRELVASEFFPEELPSPGYFDPLVCRKDKSYHEWPSFVSQYSKGRLSFCEDKLAAISGIAHAVQKSTKDSYLAGLWKEKIEIQLLWNVTNPQPKPQGFQAPSWSWAAVNGKILIPREDQTGVRHVHILDVHVVASGEDPLGKVSGGLMTLAYSRMACGRYGRVIGRIRHNPNPTSHIPHSPSTIHH